MKYSFNYISVLVLIPIFFLLSCTSDNNYVGKHQWKHFSGISIGDWLNFKESNMVIKNDTIYINDSAKAIINQIEKRLFADDLLFINELKEGQIGQYVRK